MLRVLSFNLPTQERSEHLVVLQQFVEAEQNQDRATERTALGHRLDIWWASLSAALVSLSITVPAMFVGHKLGHKVGAKGGAFGGAILILLGIYELLQYYKVF